MLGEGVTVRVIHVLRKPLSEGTVASNTLKHGTGGLNIDACRISSLDPLSRKNAARNNDVYNEGVWKSGVFGSGDAAGGRWPANVILQHLEGCRCEGTKQVRGSSAGQTGGHSWGLVNDDGWEPKGVPDQRPWMKGATEGVANWICEPGCPVAQLDGQSGALTSGTGAVKRGSSRNTGGNGGAAYGAESRSEGTPMVSYGDTGGASRFYKQVGGKTDG